MTEEEYFRKNYPEYTCREVFLSPYWDLFEEGIAFAQSQLTEKDKQIEELKMQSAICEEGLKKQISKLEAQKEELENKLENIRHYLDNDIPLEFINEATTIIYSMV